MTDFDELLQEQMQDPEFRKEYEALESEKVCYVCYEENSPALADEIGTAEDRGWISVLSVMETADASAMWVQSRILEGRENGFRLAEWSEEMDHDVMTEMLEQEGKLKIVMMDVHESERWYNIVVMARPITKDYAV